MKRWIGSGLLSLGLLVGGAPVFADEADTAALKAEIEVLKQRLASLESQVALTGGIETGEKAVPGLLQLPSGLAGLQMSGYADIAYGFNFNESDPATTATVGRAFDNESHGFTPHAFELVLEKPITDVMPLGFRTDLFFGDDAEIIHSTGLGAGGSPTDSFDLQQLYITARSPIEGLEFKVGKFVTLLGAEVIESPANWNYSRSLLFFNAIPFTHTGALATYPLGEWGSTTFGVVNGWDIVDDNNKAKSLLGNLTLTPLEDLTLSFNGITGAERAGDSRNKRTVFDVVATWTPPIEHLTLMANYDFGHESGVTQGTAPTAAAATRKGFDSAEWTGLALYAKYDLSDAWSLAGRWEWFDDKDNARLGATGPGSSTLDDLDIYAYTLTSQWKLHEHVLARLEYRHDKADERVFLRDETFSDYLDTVAAELIYHF